MLREAVPPPAGAPPPLVALTKEESPRGAQRPSSRMGAELSCVQPALHEAEPHK